MSSATLPPPSAAPPVRGLLRAVDTRDDALLFFPASGGPSQYIFAAHYQIRHADEPGIPLTTQDCPGYAVSVASTMAEGSAYPPGMILLMGGIAPHRFAEIVAQAEGRLAEGIPAAEVAGDPVVAALVEHGLGSRFHGTREAAQRMLVTRGASAVAALVAGRARSKDWEVRDRCGFALDEIQHGRNRGGD